MPTRLAAFATLAAGGLALALGAAPGMAGGLSDSVGSGFVRAFDDGRNNAHRGPRTEAGAAAMAQVWRPGVPQRVRPDAAAGGRVALPSSLQQAFDDGRLNPNRARGTAGGTAQMNRVWSDGVPRRARD